MKYNLRTYFAAWALLLAGAASLTGCTGDDDFGRIPEGSIPLSIGSVGVAGVETAGGSTRAAITENASGFTGIRKSRFVNTDALALTLSNDGGTTTTGVTATLTGGQWVLNPAKNYILPGTTTIKATYTPTATSGMKADVLEATTYTLEGQTVTFDMKHANAMIDITYTAGVVPTGITVTAHNGTADETLATAIEEEAGGVKHFRTIASPGTVKSLTAVINGKNYVATLATPLAVAANKCYPIALTFKENVVTATVGTATLNWGTGGAGELYPLGYDYYIGTPEDLAQFAKDVNDNVTGARTAKVLQTADIDLAQLKTAAEATAATGKTYTYTAIAENWVPVGTSGDFTGTYNGNGHTISNMKITASTNRKAGFFGMVSDATLTGIHLRGVSISLTGSDRSDYSTLCFSVGGTTKVSLCSATGDISGEQDDNVATGGFIGSVKDNAIITRCSSGVNITSRNYTSGTMTGGFVGSVEGAVIIAGCSYNGNLNCPLTGYVGGFIGRVKAGNICIFGCSSSGTMTVIQNSSAWAFLNSDANVTITGCYSTMSGTNIDGFGYITSINSPVMTCTDCAWTGTQSPAIAGVTGDVAVADLYDKITAYNVRTADPVKTLHWSAADGYTTTEATAQKWDAKGVWKDNGTAAPTVNMAYEGGNLSAPGAIVSGNEVWELKGYYLTAPDADVRKTYQWAASTSATVMDNDLCAGHGNWRMPTMKDFEAMAEADWAAAHPWTQDVDETITAGSGWGSSPAFGSVDGAFWSSVECTSPATSAWGIQYHGGGGWNYAKIDKASTAFVRCVQLK